MGKRLDFWVSRIVPGFMLPKLIIKSCLVRIPVSNDLMKNPPRANPDMVQITEYKGGWKLEQVGPNKTRVTLTGHADPAGAIPTFISNLFATQQPYEMMVNLQKQSDKARYKDGEVTF